MQSRSFPDHRRCGISLRGRQPSDAVQEYLRRRLSLLVGLDAHPCQMVDRHGDDGDDLQCVASQQLLELGVVQHVAVEVGMVNLQCTA